MLRKLTGIVLMSLPFAGVFCLYAASGHVWLGLLVYTLTAAAFVSIIAGVYLLYK